VERVRAPSDSEERPDLVENREAEEDGDGDEEEEEEEEPAAGSAPFSFVLEASTALGALGSEVALDRRKALGAGAGLLTARG
jgi:hypothetical protein